MKKIWILLLLCGMSIYSIGQVASSYTMILNDDTTPLNATLENKKIIVNFQKTDVLTITFKELKADMPDKSVEITTESADEVILVGTFGRDDFKEDNTYVLSVSFSNLQEKLNNANSDEAHTLSIRDKTGRQKLLMFKLL
ncbi:MAG: hypothetical protein M0Q90_09805 [Bacteroidales bacterium]|nr:hypothetical protein [Bacteroidales bacterium]